MDILGLLTSLPQVEEDTSLPEFVDYLYDETRLPQVEDMSFPQVMDFPSKDSDIDDVTQLEATLIHLLGEDLCPARSSVSSPLQVESSPARSSVSSPLQVEQSPARSSVSSPLQVEPSPARSSVSSPLQVEPSPARSSVSSPLHVEPIPTYSSVSKYDSDDKSCYCYLGGFVSPVTCLPVCLPFCNAIKRTEGTTQSTPVKSTAHILRLIQDDHSYSSPFSLARLEIKTEIEENEDSIPQRPPSPGSSVPDIETTPVYISDDNTPLTQSTSEPKPRTVAKSRGKNLDLLKVEKEKTVTAGKRRGRKPKNSPPAKRTKVGRPRTKNPPVGSNALKLEAALQRQSCSKNTRGRKKNKNSVDTRPETSTPMRSDSDNDYFDLSRHNDAKRACHNEAERLRRQQMGSLYIKLKSVVPETAHKPKPSKVTILKAARKHVVTLGHVERRSLREKKALQQQLMDLIASLESAVENFKYY